MLFARTPAVRTADQIAKMRRAGRVVAEMHERDPRRHPARASPPASSTGSAATCSTAAAPRSNFLGYHGVPGGDLRLAQRHDRPRHPRPTTRSWPRATSSRSTAAPSSTAGTATPPSPPRVGDDRPRGAAPDRGHRGRRSPPASPPWSTGNRIGDIGARRASAVAEAAGFGVVRGLHRPRHRPGHARGAQGARTRATPGTGAKLARRQRVRRRAHGRRWAPPTPACSTTTGASSPPTARWRPTPSTPSPSPTTAPRSSPSREPADHGRHVISGLSECHTSAAAVW